MEALPSPEKEIATACYYLCFLVHETKTSTDLFPLKHNVLEKIFKSGHNSLTVNYVRRGDREIYHLSPDAKKSWETETGGNKHHVRMYLTPKCKVEFEEGYFDLYHFHIVMEPFRFSFYLPIHQAPVAGQEKDFQETFPLSANCGIRARQRQSNHHVPESDNDSAGRDKGGASKAVGSGRGQKEINFSTGLPGLAGPASRVPRRVLTLFRVTALQEIGRASRPCPAEPLNYLPTVKRRGGPVLPRD